jgi:hypothetical protein
VAGLESSCRGFAEEMGAVTGSPTARGMSLSFSESDDEGAEEVVEEDDDDVSDSAEAGVACFFRGALLRDVSLSDEESEELDDEEDDARRRLRFLLRLRGAVGLAVGILWPESANDNDGAVL